MKTKYTLFRRGAMFYMQDSATGKQTSLRTKDEAEASSLLNARNAAQQQPTPNLHLARAYLPPYSPDFNPIENFWSKVKQHLRGLAPRTDKELLQAFGAAVAAVTAADCCGFFLHANYAI